MSTVGPDRRKSFILVILASVSAIVLSTGIVEKQSDYDISDVSAGGPDKARDSSKSWNDLGDLIGQMLSQVVGRFLSGCHLLTIAPEASLLQPFLRSLFVGGHPTVVADTSKFLSFHKRNLLTFLKGLWPERKETCRAIILDVTGVDAYSILNVLESLDLWLQPNTVVIFIGRRAEVDIALFHPALRNTHHTLYLAPHDGTLEALTAPLCVFATCRRNLDWQKPVISYWRCLYCKGGNQGIESYGSWNLFRGLPREVQIFQDQTKNFNGHVFTVIGLDFFPIMDYEPNSDQIGTTITLKDCLDRRILTSVSSTLNFNYITKEPSDGEWGLDQDGNWTGIVGDLQHNKADFSLLLGLLDSRAKVMDYSDIYINDRWVIISLKNQPMTQYLALVKPFTVGVWIGVLGSTVLLGMVLWLLTRLRMWFSKEQGMSLSMSILFSWGALLCNPSGNPPVAFTVRMLIAWLWIFTVIVTSAYKSSLIAHLTVHIFPPPINSFKDLVTSEGVTWGSEPLYGTEVLFFNSSLDPVINEFYSKIEFGTLKEHMNRVMEGQHAFFNSKTYMRHMIASEYTDTYGFTPLHFSQHQYPTSAGSVWGYRRGAPFGKAITRLRRRFTEMGLFDYWLQDVINTRAKQIREELKEKRGELRFESDKEASGGEEVLSLSHLQGCFYLMVIGYTFAVAVLVLENFAYFVK